MRGRAAVTPPEYLAGLKAGYGDMNGEISLLKAVIRELSAEKKIALTAMRELLSGHDNLYRAYFGPGSDPTNDIAAKAARAFLDGPEP
jgi:hypothetical protein